MHVALLACLAGSDACVTSTELGLQVVAAELLDGHAAGIRIGQPADSVRARIAELPPGEDFYWSPNWDRSPDFGALGVELRGDSSGGPSRAGGRVSAVILVARQRSTIDSLRSSLTARLGPPREGCRISGGPGDQWRVSWWQSASLTVELGALADPGAGSPQAPSDVVIHEGAPESYASGDFSAAPCAPAT